MANNLQNYGLSISIFPLYRMFFNICHDVARDCVCRRRWQIILQGLILWPSSVRVMATWPITMNINIQTLKTRRNTYLCQIKDTVHSCIRIHIVEMLNFNNIAHLKLPTGWLLLLIPPLISTLWQYFVCKQGHRIFNGSVWFSENRIFLFSQIQFTNLFRCIFSGNKKS